jgi:hypothetical protein
MRATAKAPPAAPPAIAATEVLFEAGAVEDAADAVVIVLVCEAEVAVEEAILVALLDSVVPPVAWYALRRSSRFRMAGSRSPSGQADWLHALVLQQPQKVSE